LEETLNRRTGGISCAPIDWQQENSPAVSYLEIKNQVGDGQGESPVLV
jgi:hypothetical protein